MTLRHLGLALLASACAGGQPATRPPETFAGRPFAFGLERQTGKESADVSAARLSAYLGTALDLRVTAPVFDTPRQLAEALASSRVDAAWMSPGAYVYAARLAEVEPILKLSRGGFGRYRSVFFTKAGAGIKSLTGMRGRSLALLGPGSMSGHLFPVAYLRKQNINARSFFKRVIEAKDHAEVCRLVLEGKVDAGVTLSDYRAPDEMAADGCAMGGMDPEAFTVFGAVGPIPNDIIAVRPNLEADVQQRLSEALMEMRRSEAGRKQMDDIFHADGFVPAQDTDFVVVRELEQYLAD